MITFNENDIEQMVLEVVSQIKGTLNERFSSKLYHFTKIKTLCEISKTGVFRLPNGNGIDNLINKNYPYYMSFTRERTSRTGYSATMNGEFDQELGKKARNVTPSSAYWVRIEIDGDKLNNHFKGNAVNYHSYSNRLNPISKSNNPIKYRQAEDRLFSNKNELPLIMKNNNGEIKDLGIITRIDIFFPEKYRKENNETFKKITWLMRSPESIFKDKVYLYSDKTNFDNIKGVDKIDNSKLPKTFKTLKEDKFTESMAKRLMPLISILYVYKQKFNKRNIEVKDVVKDILSTYAKTITKEKYKNVVEMICNVCKKTKIEYLNLAFSQAENLNLSFIKSTFKDSFLPIYQQCMKLYRDLLKNINGKTLTDILIFVFSKNYNRNKKSRKKNVKYKK